MSEIFLWPHVWLFHFFWTSHFSSCLCSCQFLLRPHHENIFFDLMWWYWFSYLCLFLWWWLGEGRLVPWEAIGLAFYSNAELTRIIDATIVCDFEENPFPESNITSQYNLISFESNKYCTIKINIIFITKACQHIYLSVDLIDFVNVSFLMKIKWFCNFKERKKKDQIIDNIYLYINHLSPLIFGWEIINSWHAFWRNL